MQINIDDNFRGRFTPIRPEWIDMPRNGEKCPYSSLKRKAMDFLTRPQERNNFNPPVKSRVLTQGGKGQWRRMVHLQSLMDYIESLPVELEETARKKAALAHHRLVLSANPPRRRVKEQEEA